jgi:hypothetical protein
VAEGADVSSLDCEDGIDETAWDRAMSAPTIRLESHPLRDYWRWFCPCGSHGVWLANMSTAWSNAAKHQCTN